MMYSFIIKAAMGNWFIINISKCLDVKFVNSLPRKFKFAYIKRLGEIYYSIGSFLFCERWKFMEID